MHVHHFKKRGTIGAERGDDLGLGIEFDAEAAVIIGGLGPAQARNSPRRRISVGAGLAHRFDQLFDDMGRRRHVGIAHAEIDDVFATSARLRLEAVHLFEDIRRQPFYSVEFVHDIN